MAPSKATSSLHFRAGKAAIEKNFCLFFHFSSWWYINEDMGVHASLALKTNWHTVNRIPAKAAVYQNHKRTTRERTKDDTILPNDGKESVQKRLTKHHWWRRRWVCRRYHCQGFRLDKNQIEWGLSLNIANLMVEIAKISHSWQHWMPGMPYQKLRNATSQNISRLELPPSIHYYTNPGGYK